MWCSNCITTRSETNVRKKLKIQVLTDNETLFNGIIRKGSTTKEKVMMDVKAEREAYKEWIINKVIWIKRKYNLADTKTKASILPEFLEAWERNQLCYEIEQSVNRKVSLPTNEKEKDRVWDNTRQDTVRLEQARNWRTWYLS